MDKGKGIEESNVPSGDSDIVAQNEEKRRFQ